jgi:hypothetical protein
MNKKPKDRHLDVPGEANRDKHVDFIAEENRERDPDTMPSTGRLAGSATNKEVNKKRKAKK